jgi:zinc transport system ATP-binding protein
MGLTVINMEEILSVKNLTFGYEKTYALEKVSFGVKKGDYIAIAGPNGAGKTTLINVILGLLKPKSGSVKIFPKNLGYLPQRVNTFNSLFPVTVKEVVGLGLLSQKKYPKMFNRFDEERIDEALKLLGIFNLKNRSISQLSGGQQQMVFLARALVSRPELLILDEPVTALDPERREQFFELIDKLNKENKVTILMITHDVSHIGEYANKLLFLDRKIVFYGPFKKFCTSVDMEKYFGHFAQHLICHQH